MNATYPKFVFSNTFRKAEGNTIVLDRKYNPEQTQAETWTLTAISATEFTVVPSLSKGDYPNAVVGKPYKNIAISFALLKGTKAPEIGDMMSFDLVEVLSSFA